MDTYQRHTRETDIGSECADEMGTFQGQIMGFIFLLQWDFISSGDETSSELSSSDASVI